EALARLLTSGVFAEEFGVILSGKVKLLHGDFDFAGYGTQIAARDVAGYVEAARCGFAFDFVGGGLDVNVGDVFEWGEADAGEVDRQLADRFEVRADFGVAADNHVVGFLVFVNLANFSSADERGDGVANLAGRKAEARGGVWTESNLDLRHQNLSFDFQVGD